MDRYHTLADTTMTSLLERLEELLDEISNEGFEVDYHVSFWATTTKPANMKYAVKPLMYMVAEWGINTQPWFEWDVCHQQATSKQANLAFVPRQVRPTPSTTQHPFLTSNPLALSQHSL